MSKDSIKKIQQGLFELGYDPKGIDGVYGKNTQKAAMAWVDADGQPRKNTGFYEPPWMAEAKKVMGLHEAHDNAALRKFLKEDGRTLGDPAELPWCGDFVQTCIRLALPDEVFPPALEKNPYWARNWAFFGIDMSHSPMYGCVAVFERGPNAGHVAFLTGNSPKQWRVIGGNQSNRVSEMMIDKSRTIAMRWPASYPPSLFGALPVVNPGSSPTSVDEN